MSKCKKCNHNCHCNGDLHADEYGICVCDNCQCKREYKKEKDHATDMTYENEKWGVVMNYRFTGILIILMCLLAFCVKPASHTPLKTNLKDYIIVLPEPVISDNEKAWNEID